MSNDKINIMKYDLKSMKLIFFSDIDGTIINNNNFSYKIKFSEIPEIPFKGLLLGSEIRDQERPTAPGCRSAQSRRSPPD